MKKTIAVLAVAAGASFPLIADGYAVGDTMAESSASVTFALNTADGSPFAYNRDSFAEWPVTWRAGETVTATAWDGTEMTLNASSDAGSAAFVPSANGVWTLSNSGGKSVVVGKAWDADEVGETLAQTTLSSLFAAHTEGEGPDRRLKRSDVPPVAYSGDNWMGDASKAATVTFTPPSGSGLAPTTLNLSGTGTDTSFTFNSKGTWTVTLEFADYTTRTASVTVMSGLTIVIQ